MKTKFKLLCLLPVVCLFLSACLAPAGETQDPQDDNISQEEQSQDENVSQEWQSQDENTLIGYSLMVDGDRLNPWVHEAALTRFLTRRNYFGHPAAEEELVPPGTLAQVDAIPPADQSMVGKTVPILFAEKQSAICFHYLYDADTGTERLSVIVPAVLPLLIVFETQLGGAEALCEKISQEAVFDAKILAFVNISFEENMYAVAAGSVYEEATYKVIDISDPGELAPGEYVGIVGKSGETYISDMKGADPLSANEDLQKNLGVYYRMYTRFSLEHLFPATAEE